jgi:hypothetical protein
MRAITATVTPSQTQALVRLDNYATAVLGGAIVVSGGASFTLTHSCDDPNDLVNPVPVGSMAWDNSLLPPAAQAGSANVSFQIMASPLWFKLNLQSGAPTSQWSASDATAGSMMLSNGGLTVTPTGSSWEAIRGSISKTSGKLYIEFANSLAVTDWQWSLGLADAGIVLSVANGLGNSPHSCGIAAQTWTDVSAGFTSNYVSTLNYLPAAGDVLALAVDFAAGSIWFAYNNVWSNSSNPATGALPIVSFTPATVGALFPALSFLHGVNDGVWTLQPTAAAQKYAPPAGFIAWDSGAIVAAEAVEPRAGVGSVRATFLQVGEHSHSNISKGPFAPPKLADEMVEGTNFGAMPK